MYFLYLSFCLVVGLIGIVNDFTDFFEKCPISLNKIMLAIVLVFAYLFFLILSDDFFGAFLLLLTFATLLTMWFDDYSQN